MSKRPAGLEIRAQSYDPSGAKREPFSRPLPSPRLHMAGEIPPELSPLDAFAAQSRMLARKLEEGKKSDRRMSRLPPQSLELSLAAARPTYLRAMTAQEAQLYEDPPRSPGIGVKMEMENAKNRPMSIHPRMSKVPSVGPDTPRFDLSELESNRDGDAERGRKTFDDRDILPLPTDGSYKGQAAPNMGKVYAASAGTSPIRPASRQLDRGLAPPRSPLLFSSHPAQDSNETLTDTGTSDMNDATQRPPPPRKFSSSSGVSNSALSPRMHPEPRSPSAASDKSSSFRLSRPAFNFSRPLSRMEHPVRQPSTESDRPSLTDDSASVTGKLGGSYDSSLDVPGSSYVYSSFVLPRGKPLQRSSSSPTGFKVEFDGPGDHLLQRSQTADERPPSPQLCHSPTQIQTPVVVPPPTAPSVPPVAPVQATAPPPSLTPRLSEEKEHTAEWHVTKGIDCHEKGSLNESTYHLRKAALANHPTGMLLYALACRHGWGMRVDQEQGNIWLRKAADIAQVEMAEDKDLIKEGKNVDVLAQKARKAQFALSIYELGVSYLNGWGIEQDKKLALRCFEIAGSWGDGDALAEAGFCYAQGIGCKKDMKKSAGLYRQAEKKGISMVGNSWIYKSKYQDGPPAEEKKDEKKDDKKKPRDKSRTRSIFGRKKTS